MAKDLKDRLACNALTIGSWLNLGQAGIAEILADAGFEWLVVDLEHSTIGTREAGELIRVIDLKGVPALVRLTANDPGQIKRMLDAGAHGVIVPMVNSRADAAAAVAAAKYAPAGRRGVGLARAQGYGPGFAEYAAGANARTIVIAQIEHVDAISNLEAILAVPGIDGTIIGPYDLSGSVGKPGRYDDPDVAHLLARYEEVCRSTGRPMGFHVVSADHQAALEKLAKGYTFLAFGVDFLFLGEMARRELAALRARCVV